MSFRQRIGRRYFWLEIPESFILRWKRNSVGLVRSSQRYRHRAEVAFVLQEKCCNLGIGGKMMEMCLTWCAKNNVIQRNDLWQENWNPTSSLSEVS